ncbi:hypothetical protein HMPREF9554_01007, partial [Treponema phagedenis F0421]
GGQTYHRAKFCLFTLECQAKQKEITEASPLLNSKRCLKTTTQLYIEVFKLAGEAKGNY